MAHDGEPEPGAPGVPAPTVVDPVEALEDPVEVAGGNADAAVLHREADVVALLGCASRRGPTPSSSPPRAVCSPSGGTGPVVLDAVAAHAVPASTGRGRRRRRRRRVGGAKAASTGSGGTGAVDPDGAGPADRAASPTTLESS